MAGTPVKTEGFPTGMAGDIRLSREERRGDVAVWDLCFRFLAGDQYIGWGPNRLALVSLLPPYGQNATVTNLLLRQDAAFRHVLRTNLPKPVIRPASTSTDDLANSLASAEAARYLWVDNKLRKVLDRGAQTLSGAGTAALWTTWDADKERVAIKHVSAYDLLFEPYANSYEESRWRAVRCIYTRGEVAKAYPDFAGFINDLPILGTDEDRNRQKMPNDRIELWHCYFNDGKYGILCGDEWIWTGETPEGVMPVVPYGCHRIEGLIWSLPLLYPMLDHQRSYNKFKNFCLDIADAVSSSPWLVPTTASVNKAQLQNNPRGIIEYNPVGGEPKRHPAPNVPPHLFEIQNRIQAELQDVGLHPASLGKKQGGVVSAVAMDTIINQDAAAFSGTMTDIEEAVAQTLGVGLVFWKHYLSKPTQILMLDQTEGTVLSRQIAKTDFVDKPEVYIEPGTMFAVTGEGRDEELEKWMQAGVLDAETVKREMTLQVDRQDAVKKLVSLQRAEDMLEAVKKGIEIEIFPYDDLKSIQQVFEEYVNSPDYYAESVAAREQYLINPTNETATALADALGKHEYIREVLVSVQAPAQMSREQIKQIAETRIFPRPAGMPMQQGLQQPPQGPQQPQGQQSRPAMPAKPPGPVPAQQRPVGAPPPRGDPLQASATNVRGGIG